MHRIASDSELIAASIDDPLVFTRLFDRHFVEIHAFAQRRLGTRLADRVAAQTFVEAFHERSAMAAAVSAGTGTGEGDARPWLFGIVVRLIACHDRRERRMLKRYARRGPSLLGEAELAAREGFAPRASRQRLARSMARLDSPLRNAILLDAWTALTREQAASALGCDEGELSHRLSEARHRLAGRAVHGSETGAGQGTAERAV